MHAARVVIREWCMTGGGPGQWRAASAAGQGKWQANLPAVPVRAGRAAREWRGLTFVTAARNYNYASRTRWEKGLTAGLNKCERTSVRMNSGAVTE